MIKILSFDLDGTLLLSGTKDIDPRTLNSIEKAKQQGIHICLASGRDKYGCQQAYEWLHLKEGNHFLSLKNGQIIYDFQKKRYEAVDTIPANEGMYIQNVCKEYGLDVLFCCGYDFYVYSSSNSKLKRLFLKSLFGKPSHHGFVDQQKPNSYIETNKPIQIEQDIVKAVCIGNFSLVKEKFNSYDIHMGPGYAILLPKSITKAKSLEKIASLCHCTLNEVMAFGDAGNDLEMIEAAGIGVAMGNAMKEVKDKANLVTLSNNQNGIGVVVDALLDGKEEELRKIHHIEELF